MIVETNIFTSGTASRENLSFHDHEEQQIFNFISLFAI